MRIRYILPLFIFALLVSTNADAQKRKAKTKKVQPVEDTVNEELYETMLYSTQKIMFVDSVSVSKKDMLKHIKLSKDIGRVLKYSDVFDTKDSSDAHVFVNGFNNKCYFSKPSKNGLKLYTSDKIDNKWNDPIELTEINTQAKSLNYPYMMTDGITLYFAAKSEENSLGGYDIFVTRFDSESGKFLKAENVGMPFNSRDNDYLYVVDDVNNIGWFVTDRNRIDGKVTIYTFIPEKIRTNYDIDELGEETVTNYAKINDYKKTWTSKEDRNKIIKKIENINSVSSSDNKSQMFFAINDNTVYSSISDFKSEKAKKAYETMIENESRLEILEKATEEKRIRYHKSEGDVRKKLATEILKAEKDIEQTCSNINSAKMTAINEENKTINKKGK